MSAAGRPGDASLVGLDAAGVDALLTVLARHARDLAGWGPVTLSAGPLTLRLGDPASVDTLPAPVPAPVPVPYLTAVPPVTEPTEPIRPSVEADASAAPEGPVVCSTTVGVFYRASEPGAAPFVSEGDEITVGQQVGLVEAMKLMIPLESDRAGRIVAVLVADGEAVEHGQPVLRLASS